MGAIYFLFARQLVRQTAIYTAATTVGFLALRQFMFSHSAFNSLMILAAVWVGAAVYQSSQCIPRNLNWLVAMPITKLNLIWLTSAINLTIAALTLAGFTVSIVGADLLKAGELDLARVLGFTLYSFGRYAWLKLFQFPTAFAWATLFLVTGYVFLLFTTPSWRGGGKFDFRRAWEHVMNPADPRERNYYRALFGAALAIVLFGRDYVLAPFGVFVAFLIVIARLCPRMWRVSVNFPAPQQKVAMAVLAVLASIQILWVFGLERKALHSMSTDARVRAIEFLGPFSGRLSQATLAEILAAPLTKDSIAVIGRNYLRQFHEGTPIDGDRDAYLKFPMAVRDKEGMSAIAETLKLFRVNSLTVQDLKALFKAMSPLTKDPREQRLFLNILNARLSPEEQLAMLDSPVDAEINYALVRGRYDRDARLIPRIQRNLPRYSDELVYVALQTLSLLKGERLTLAHWKDMKQGRQPAFAFAEPDCDSFQPQSVDGLAQKDFVLLNLCLRARADRHDIFMLEDIEEAGWIAPPVNSFQRTIVGDLFNVF